MYTQILVPLDGSKLAEKALPHAQVLAKTYGATVHLLQVFSHHPAGGQPHGEGLEAGGNVGSRAGLAGGIISIAVIRHDYGTKEFERIVLDASDLILISLAVLAVAAVVEVYVTPLFF